MAGDGGSSAKGGKAAKGTKKAAKKGPKITQRVGVRNPKTGKMNFTTMLKSTAGKIKAAGSQGAQQARRGARA